ncbi:MAG: shikimate kinase [Caulobacteraceae bacterium]|nr:shikimate kinase [Caulobacteraceae bacterium]
MSRPLNRKTIALVGHMGVGKSSIGRRLATALAMPFRDADAEIEKAAGRSIPEIFSQFGEAAFREGERRVIARLLDEPPHVLATGGGAFDDEGTRALIREKAISVWLKADLELLARRVGRRDTRPLVSGKDPLEVLRQLAVEREPAFAQADIIVETGEAAHQVAVDAVIKALGARLAAAG